MKHQKLHDLAKFAAGLVLADFICGWWMSTSNLLPQNFLGATITSSMILPWMIFDAALFIILVHYGWHIGRTPTLRTRTYFAFVGTIMGIVALAHLVRLFSSAEVNIAGWIVPLWLSWIGVAVAAYLSYMSFRLAVSMKK
ncbi:MAG: hypothetical protein KGI45_02920 [Patescibacteria group bacterium]|nr:hypothetical protein [Patescibacteria group bacterium]MDE1966997.1 hypothetical protein [Patescibacteria group bacterium]